MSVLKVRSPQETQHMKGVEPPRFVLGLAGEGPVSENENCFPRLMHYPPRVASTLQLPAAEGTGDIVFCLFSLNKPFPSSCWPLEILQRNMDE